MKLVPISICCRSLFVKKPIGQPCAAGIPRGCLILNARGSSSGSLIYSGKSTIRRAKKMKEQQGKPRIHPLSFVGALIFALALIGLAYLVFLSQADKAQPVQTTPQYQVTLLPAPTETPTLVPTSML